MILIRRILENIAINLISALPIYILLKLQIIYPSKLGNFIAFLISAIIFFSLNAKVLKEQLLCTLDCGRYLKINTGLLIFQFGICLVCMCFDDAEIYTALFGFTRVFRVFININSPFLCNLASMCLFWGIYLFQIIYYYRKLSDTVDRIKEDINEYGMTEYNLIDIFKHFIKK